MTLLLACCLLAAGPAGVVVPELRVSPAHWLTGEPSMNAQVCRFDAEAPYQFLFSDHLALSDEEGAFRPIPLPEAETPVWYEAVAPGGAIAALVPDADRDLLAVKDRTGLALFRLSDEDTWAEVWRGAWAWPGAETWESEQPALGIDLCLVHCTESGVWQVRPSESEPLTLLYQPEPQLRLVASTDLFSTGSSGLAQGEFRSSFEHFQFPDGRWASVQLAPDVYGSGAVYVLHSGASGERRPLALPADAYPVFIDPEAREPVFAQVSTRESDAGLISESRRVLKLIRPDGERQWDVPDPLAYQRAVSLAHLNADDKLDLVLQEFRIIGPDPKESLSRLFTSDRVRLRIAVFLCGADGIASRPAWVDEIEIQLDEPPANRGPRLDALLRGDLLAFAPVLQVPGADWSQLIVHERPGQLGIYAMSEQGLGGSPEWVVGPSPTARLRTVPREGLPSLIAVEESTSEGTITRLLPFLSEARP
ncbi:MAG: hypothetical protein GC168_11355 [Candidatus Hydrogenedens sp.]|nr:hypothetical protein [Candidatus Hydrogenedens sp.]